MDEAKWKDDIDELCRRLLDLSNASRLDLGERLHAFMFAIGDMVASIDCRDCRALTRKLIDQNFPEMLDRAMDYGSKQPSRSNHVH